MGKWLEAFGTVVSAVGDLFSLEVDEIKEKKETLEKRGSGTGRTVQPKMPYIVESDGHYGSYEDPYAALAVFDGSDE